MVLPEQGDDRHRKEGHLQEGKGVEFFYVGAGGFHKEDSHCGVVEKIPRLWLLIDLEKQPPGFIKRNKTE